MIYIVLLISLIFLACAFYILRDRCWRAHHRWHRLFWALPLAAAAIPPYINPHSTPVMLCAATMYLTLYETLKPLAIGTERVGGRMYHFSRKLTMAFGVLLAVFVSISYGFADSLVTRFGLTSTEAEELLRRTQFWSVYASIVIFAGAFLVVSHIFKKPQIVEEGVPYGTIVSEKIPGTNRKIIIAKSLGVSKQEAAEIRASYGSAAEDWDDPAMDKYDAL